MSTSEQHSVANGQLHHDGHPPLLELVDVHAGYGAIEVLHGVSLEVDPGAVIALFGPNGGGKTTTIKVCAGLVSPTAGEVRLAGRRVNGLPAHHAAGVGVRCMPEGPGVFANLTVRENLRLATPEGRTIQETDQAAFERFPVLGTRRSQLAGTLSGGEQRMLALACVLVTDPAVLLLDEVSAGLAPAVVELVYETVAELAAGGVSVLVAEQFVSPVLPVADLAVVLSGGRVVAAGRPGEIESQLEDGYLGG